MVFVYFLTSLVNSILSINLSSKLFSGL